MPTPRRLRNRQVAFWVFFVVVLGAYNALLPRFFQHGSIVVAVWAAMVTLYLWVCGCFESQVRS